MANSPNTKNNQDQAPKPLAPEAQSPKLREVLHYPKTDIVINNDAQHAYLGHQLAELFKDGTPPQSWRRIAPDFKPIDPSAEEEKAVNHGPRPGMAVGELDGVRLILKVKRSSGTGYQFEKESVHIRAMRRPKASQPEIVAWGMNIARGLNSGVREIGVAPRLKRVVAGEDFQNLARTYGFNSFRYVEPIIGIVNKETGVKSHVYDYIPDAENLVALMESDDDRAQRVLLGGMDQALKDLLAHNGIDASSDIGEHQVLVDPENNLYLIDAETFLPLKGSAGATDATLVNTTKVH